MDDLTPNQANPEADEVKVWFDEINDAKKRSKNFFTEGDRVLNVYANDDKDKVPFNILFSNTDTLLPAYYSDIPRPDVRRRFDDNDPVGKAASEAGNRMLSFIIDTNLEGYETFDDAMKAAVFDALLPGRGITAVKYEVEINEYGEEQEESENAEARQERLLEKERELIYFDSQPWNQVLFGFARKWSYVPWIAFEQSIDKAEAIRLFGEEMAAKIQFTPDNVGPDEESEQKEDEHQGERKTALIFQIWDRSGGKKVRYVSRHYKDGYLRVLDDPLELTGFYPIPKPLQFVANNQFQPIAPYLLYESQAQELNDLTRRIKRIVKAIKAKGVYDSALGDDIKDLLEGDDNEFIPADQSAALTAQGGFEKSIWFMPVEKLIVVLQQLYAAREQCKQVIYEITGISDIIRGSTVASETATAQNIKSQWGTMRLKRGQIEVQHYARGIMRIMLEIASTKFSEQTWAQITSLPYLTEQQFMQASMIVQRAQTIEIPPESAQQVQQQVQQAQQMLQQPKWSDVLGLLKSDLQRSYRVDIETDSTILPEQREDQQSMTEAFGALGQYVQGVTPLVQQGIMPFEAAKQMMISFIRRYRFGDQLEDYLEQMQPPQPQDNTLQVKQMEMQGKQAELQSERQIEAARMQHEVQIEQLKASNEAELEQMRLKHDMKKHIIDANLASGDSVVQLDDSGEETLKPETLDKITGAFAESNQNMAQSMQQIASMMGEMMQTMVTLQAQILQVQNAPKRVIRDENGTVVGVVPVDNA